MRKCIINEDNNKKQKAQRVSIPWGDKMSYVRYGIVGGILENDPKESKNVCYLTSRVSGRKIRIRYGPVLHENMSSLFGERVMITGLRYYTKDGKLDSMDAESIEKNENQNTVQQEDSGTQTILTKGGSDMQRE